MITFTPVERIAVRDVWPLLRPGLDALISRHEGNWMPEDVYAELVGGRVTLYIMEREETMQGFFIARAHADYDGVVLFIWVMWAEPHAMTPEEVLPEIDKLAKSVNAKRIRHESPREGWTKKGFELTQHVYEREVK